MNGELYDFLMNSTGKNAVVDFAQLPDIPLYMDQLTTFIEDRLKTYKRSKNDKILTKTMINNYSKDNLLPPSVKKKYDKEHIALLILIYHLKSCVTINDISAIFDVMEEKQISVERTYRAFTKIQEAENALIEGKMNELAQTLPSTDDPASELFAALSLIAEANARKLLAERLIDKMHAEITNVNNKGGTKK